MWVARERGTNDYVAGWCGEGTIWLGINDASKFDTPQKAYKSSASPVPLEICEIDKKNTVVRILTDREIQELFD